MFDSVLTKRRMYSSTSGFTIGENTFFFFISSFVFVGVCIYVQHFFDTVRNQTSNRKYLPELIKRRSKVHQKNMSREPPLSFDQ